MTLKSIEVSRREEEQSKLKKQQKFQMELDRIESVNENYNTSRSSTTDKYMISAHRYDPSFLHSLVQTELFHL